MCVSVDIVFDLEIFCDVCYEMVFVINSFVMKIYGYGVRVMLGGICDYLGYGVEMGVCSKVKFGYEVVFKLVCFLVFVYCIMLDCSSVRFFCVGKYDGIGFIVLLMDIIYSWISCGFVIILRIIWMVDLVRVFFFDNFWE